MDPITMTLGTALVAGVAGGVTEVGKQMISDGYGRVKALLAKKYGPKSEVVTALAKLEERPQSEPRKAVLAEAIEDANIAQDVEIQRAVQSLAIVLKEQGATTINYSMNIYGGNNANSQGSGSATLNIYPSQQKPD